MMDPKNTYYWLSRRKKGVMLPLVVFLILGVAAMLPLLINMTETTQQRAQSGDDWSRFQLGIKAAGQRRLKLEPTLIEPFSGIISPINETITYSGGFSIETSLSENRTHLGRYRSLLATGIAKRNGINASYTLDGLATATFSVPGVTAGGAHSFGWKSNGNLFAWGTNQDGRLGIGSTDGDVHDIPELTARGEGLPTESSCYSQAWMVAAGASHTLALDYFGNVFSWGSNIYGQLGTGNTTSMNSPVKVNLNYPIKDLAAGNGFSLALRSNGLVYTWGVNSSGQLGLGTLENTSTPLQVSSVIETLTMAGVAAGEKHAMAITNDGDIYGWGNNTKFQLGPSFNGASSTVPVRITSPLVAGNPPPADLSTKDLGPEPTYFTTETLFILGDFEVLMSKAYTGAMSEFIIILTLQPPGSAVPIILGDDSGEMVVVDEGSPPQKYRWKFASDGEGIAISSGTYRVQVNTKQGWSEGKDQENKFWYGGENGQGVFNFFRSDTGDPESYFGIAAGGDFTIALTATGTMEPKETLLYTWGDNTYGQLGRITPTGENLEKQLKRIENFPPSGERIRLITAGREHALALSSSGKVYAWGRNNYGQLGIGNTNDKENPVLVTGTVNLSGETVQFESLKIAAISAGYYHSMAIDENGNIFTWGCGASGRLGNASTANSNIPVAISSL